MSGSAIKTAPSGFVFRDIPRSTKEALSRSSFSSAVEISKNAIVSFIRNHFEGEFQEMFRAVVRSADQFVLSSNLNTQDRMQVAVQLLRRYPDFHSRLPCIVLNNIGAEPLPISIPGGFDGGFYDSANDARVMKLTTMWRIPMEIITAAADPTQADQLMESVALIFTTIKTITQTARITPEEKGHQWVVTLPPLPGPIAFSESDMHGDPANRLYTYLIPLSVTFESTVYVAYAHRVTHVAQVGPAPEITTSLPDTIRLGMPFFASPQHRPLTAYFQSDNTDVALVDENGYVYPKKLGTFTFQVVLSHAKGAEVDRPKILYSKRVRIVP